MKKNLPNKIIVSTKNGEKKEYDILFTLTSTETNKNYIIYCDLVENENNEKYTYASCYEIENNKYKLIPIDSDKEWDTITTILSNIEYPEIGGTN